jgi:hypothetical protein
MLRIRVVLPEPRKPVIMVMGVGGMVGAKGWVLGGVDRLCIRPAAQCWDFCGCDLKS